MADVNDAFDGGQSSGENLDERAGLGLLSRFLGAVFLVLLGGLLLLDRALLKANVDQAALDAQAAALVTESFVAAQAARLDQIAAMAFATGDRSDDIAPTLDGLLASVPGLRRAWIIDSSGRMRLDAAEAVKRPPLTAELLARLHAIRPSGRLGISVIPTSPGHAIIAMVRGSGRADSSGGEVVGMAFDGDSLGEWLPRTPSKTRVNLTIMSGMDTVAFLGRAGGGASALAGEPKVIRLPNGGTWGVTATHAIATRSLRWALWSLGVIGVLLLALGLLREQRRALQAASRSVELERLYSDVKRANQAKSEFLANVSHELRTPLNAIVGFVELLRDGFYGDLSPRQVPPVDRIAASATHLRHLVDQVLDIAKIAAGRLEVHAETIVLRPFVLNIASELESLVSEKNLAFSITVGASLPRVRTDPAHLRQILINLIGNAVKYTPTGTVGVRARLVGGPVQQTVRSPDVASATGERAMRSQLKAPRSGTWIALQVVDTGVGIGSADLERIFDEFEQVNAGPRGDSMNRGTGLGLAISRRLARVLGGEISVESELGRGSTFTVWLPVNPADLTREPVEGVPGMEGSSSAASA